MEVNLKYNAFISSLINNPSVTGKDRERIVKLLLKERDKKYLTKEELNSYLNNTLIDKSQKTDLQQQSSSLTSSVLILDEMKKLKIPETKVENIKHDTDGKFLEFGGYRFSVNWNDPGTPLLDIDENNNIVTNGGEGKLVSISVEGSYIIYHVNINGTKYDEKQIFACKSNSVFYKPGTKGTDRPIIKADHRGQILVKVERLHQINVEPETPTLASEQKTTSSSTTTRNSSHKNSKIHDPKYTADFLSLFNRREGFKYLTHNYDNSGLTLKDMLAQVRKLFESYSYEKRLPGSLRYLMNMFINGGEWRDFEGKKHTEGYSSESWVKWSEINDNMHPIMDIDGIESIIQRFRHTIRVVSPDLLNIIESIIQQFPTLNFVFNGQSLGKADFYTNVFILRHGLFGLIKDMADHNGHQDIEIEYKPGFDGDYFIRQIIITQLGSFSQKPINDVIERFKSEGGFFSENVEKLMGYCNWSVESLWDGTPYRWNILKEKNSNEIEQIEKENINGFSHILTFYYKD